MRQPHRLGALEVGVAGQDHVEFATGAFHEDGAQTEQRAPQRRNRVAHPEQEVRCDLVVAAAPAVQFASDISGDLEEPPLDVHVDIFVAGVEHKATGVKFRVDGLESAAQTLEFGRAQNALAREHFCVRQAAANVLAPQLPVKVDRARERFETGGGRFFEATAPGLASFDGAGGEILGFSSHSGRCSLNDRPQSENSGWTR